jgi:hypothetical protein
LGHLPIPHLLNLCAEAVLLSCSLILLKKKHKKFAKEKCGVFASLR